MSKPLTDAQKRRIIKLRAAGLTQLQIGSKIGCSRSSVQYVLNPSYQKSSRKCSQKSREKYPLLEVLSRARTRAASQGVPFDLTYDSCPPMTDNCPKCGVHYESGIGTLKMTSRSLDKIVPSKGYVAGNVMWLCYGCNRLKSDMTLADFRSWVEFLEGLI